MISGIGYAGYFVLLAASLLLVAGLQKLIDAVANFCSLIGMVISTKKTNLEGDGVLRGCPPSVQCFRYGQLSYIYSIRVRLQPVFWGHMHRLAASSICKCTMVWIGQ